MYENLIEWFKIHDIVKYESSLTPEIKTFYDNILIGNIDQSINNNIKDSNYYLFLGLFFENDTKFKNYDLMKKYYLIAIDMYNSDAMFRLVYYYFHIEKNYNLMLKYYLMSIKQNNLHAMDELGYYYMKYNYYLMRKYFVMAIKNRNYNYIFLLKKFYKQNKYKYI